MRFELKPSSAEFILCFYENIEKYNELLTRDKLLEYCVLNEDGSYEPFIIFKNDEITCYVAQEDDHLYLHSETTNVNLPSFKIKLSNSTKGVFSKTKINEMKVHLHKVVTQIKLFEQEGSFTTELIEHMSKVCVDVKSKLYSYGILSHICAKRIIARSPIGNDHFWLENALHYTIEASKTITGKITYKIKFDYSPCELFNRSYEITVTGNKNNIVSNVMSRLRKECYKR